MLATAQATAAALAAAARDQARILIDQALSEATQIRARARADGEAAARATAVLSSARARRQAHDMILATETSLREELLREISLAATALRDDPRYPNLRSGLEAYARVLLGPEVVVSESSAGGIVAEAGSRRLDLTLPVLALATTAAMSQEGRSLWAAQTEAPRED
ncbi:hypothetical protein JF66_00695 [Cryobacterium sp. MLB-32]|nr:hypothetical protein JF66_00695 [Cryobacterium sp. MLB-32]